MFKQDGIIYEFFSLLGNLMVLNLCFIIGCLPIVTIGSSITAMYSVIFKMLDDKNYNIIKDFIKSYKENIKQSTIIWVGCLIFGIGIIFNIYLLYGSKEVFFQVYKVAMLFLFIILVIFVLYVFPILSRYENNLNNLIKNTFYLMLINFTKTIFMLSVLILVLFVIFISPYVTAWSIFVFATFGFSLIGYILGHYFLLIFKNESK